MTILFICDEYPPGRNGGVGTMVQVLARELVKQGHSVFVAGLYAHSYGGKNYEEDQGVKVWRFRYGWNLHLPADHLLHKVVNKIPGMIKQRMNGKQAFDAFITFVRELIDTQHIDIIEAPDWNTFAMRIGFKVQWPAFKVPMVVKLHGSYSYLASELHTAVKPWLQDIDEALYERADALCAVSAYTAHKSKAIFEITKPITVLHNAIESRPLDPVQRESYKVIFTGTLMPLKGVYQLMKAWNLVHRAMPQARLFVYGKGNSLPLQQSLEPAAAQTVSFAGHVTRDVIFNELATATVAVFPSYSETFGLAALEAMSAGCPVIFTKRASGPELITQGINGELVDPDHVNEISEAIIRILENKTLQQQYSSKGRETAQEKFNITASAKAHIAYYTGVINQFKAKY